MDQIKSTGNSWVDLSTLAGGTKHGVAEPVTQFATAVVTITSSGGGELVIERGRTVSTLTEVQVISLTAATKKTVAVLACEALFRVTLRNTTASPTVSSVETYYYDQLFELDADGINVRGFHTSTSTHQPMSVTSVKATNSGPSEYAVTSVVRGSYNGFDESSGNGPAPILKVDADGRVLVAKIDTGTDVGTALVLDAANGNALKVTNAVTKTHYPLFNGGTGTWNDGVSFAIDCTDHTTLRVYGNMTGTFVIEANSGDNAAHWHAFRTVYASGEFNELLECVPNHVRLRNNSGAGISDSNLVLQHVRVR